MAEYSFISTVAVLYRQKVMASCRSAFDSYKDTAIVMVTDSGQDKKADE
jgi:hypothetical protein